MMPNWSNETETIMRERFGKDNVMAPATVAEGKPWVRSVNAYYEDGTFCVITYALSNKMQLTVVPICFQSSQRKKAPALHRRLVLYGVRETGLEPLDTCPKPLDL